MAEHTIRPQADPDEFTFVEAEVVPKENITYYDSTTRMSQLLRAVGALIIVAAASTFLFQRWGAGNDMSRYFLLLAFTGALSVGGFFCGVRLKESKGARTLLGLALGITPINFAVVAGLIYSRFSFDGTLGNVPEYASWVAPSTEMALLAAVSSLAVLAPLGYLGFLTLSRDRARLLTTFFLLGNFVLWIPVRQPGVIGVLVALLCFGLCMLEHRSLRHATGLKTFEGRLARLLLMGGRSFHLYTLDSLFNGSILAVIAVTGFLFLPTLTRQKRMQQLLQGASVVPAVFSWLYFVNFIHMAFHVRDSAAIPVIFLPIAFLLFIASFYAVGEGALYRRGAAVIALLAASLNLVFFPGGMSSFTCMIVAIAILVYGAMVEQKAIFFTGIVGVIFGLGYHVKYALTYFSLTSWGSLALIGVSIVIVASILEKNQGKMTQRVAELRKRFHGWSY